MNLKGKTIFFLGDSITEGACAVGMENVYHQVAARILGADTIVDGISGTRIARQQKPSAEPRFDNEFPKRLATHNEKADLAVFFGGVNDFGHGDAPFGNDGDETTDTFTGAVKVLCDMLKEKYGSNVVVILPMHNTIEDNPYGEHGRKPIAGKLLREYGLKIRQYAEEYGFYILDLWDDAELNPNIKENEYLFADGLHPTNDGHRVLGEKVAAFLSNI